MMNQRLSRFSSVRVLLLGGVALVATSQVGAVAPTFTVDEESPIALDSFVYTGAPGIKVTAGTGYVLCANTPWQQGGSPNASALQLIPTNPNGFTFGSQALTDVRSFKYRISTTAMVDVNTAGGPSTLGCYVTDAAGVRTKWYNGLYVDTFDFTDPEVPPACTDSCLHVTVLNPLENQDGTVVYRYWVNYNLPERSYGYNATLRDGYVSPPRSPLFAQTVWCNLSSSTAPDLDCPTFSPTSNTINVLSTVPVNTAIDGRVLVLRKTLPGVGLDALHSYSSSSVGPLVIAALFPEAKERADERVLYDNVSSATCPAETCVFSVP